MAMLRALVRELRESIKDSGKAQANELRQLLAATLAGARGDGVMGLATGRAFEWGYQKPTPIYYPVCLSDSPALHSPVSNDSNRKQEWWVKTIRNISEITPDDVGLVDVMDVYQDNTFRFEAEWKRSKALASRPSAFSELLERTRPSAHTRRIDHPGTRATRSLPVSPAPTPGPGRGTAKPRVNETEPEILTNNELSQWLHHSVSDPKKTHVPVPCPTLPTKGLLFACSQLTATLS